MREAASVRARPHLRARRLASVAVLVVTALIGVAFTATSAVADYSPTPRASTWSPTDGRVYAIERVGDTIFIGGSFTTLRNPTGTATVSRSRLAAFDAVTGDLLPWNPGANNEVRALQGSSDGTGLFVGGRFTAIAGAARNRLARLRTADGMLVPGFNANVNATVMALERIGTRLFLGGTFGTVNGAARTRIAAVAESTGALAAGWTGSANGAVNSIVAAPGEDRIFLGGQFRSLSGQSRDFLGALNVADGSATAWRPPIPCTDTQNPCYVLDLATDIGKVYAAVGGPGGRVIAYDIANATRQWSAYGDGDVQAVAVDSGTVYAGGHFELQFANHDRAGLVALSSASGGVLNFSPQLLNGLGVWDILAESGRLRVGGGFTTLNGSSARMRYAEFPALSDPPDTTAPTVPANLRASNVSDTLATLAWGASTDDTVVSAYRLWRDGQPLVTLGVTNYTDRGLTPSTAYTYQVQASDAAGNWSDLSAPVTVTTQPPSTSLVKPGSTWRYLSNGSDQGSAWREPGFADGAWSSGDAELGYGDSDEATVISPQGLTHYFRQRFDVDDRSRITALQLRLLRDDGAVVYINGVEVVRSNMPAGPVTYQTPASTEVTGAAENDYLSQSVPVGVLTNGTNTVAVEVHNRSGSSDVSFDLELVPTLAPGDQVAPSQPQNLREAGVTASTVDLAWDASTDNVGVTGYRITRNAAVAATVDGLSWTDTGRTPGATYTYTVTALDAAGNASAASEPLAVTMPPDTTQPSAPGSVSADPAPSGTRVDLSWAAATDDVAVAGYQVLRDGVQLGGDTTARTYADTTAQPGTTYTYAVLAVDAAGNAGPTSEVTVTTPTAPPPDPVLHAETWSADNGSPWPSAWNTSTKSGVVDVQGGAGRLRLTNTSGAFARATLTGVSPVRNTDLLFSYQWSSATARSSFNVYVRGSGGWQNGNRPMTGYGLNFVSDSSRVTVQKNVGGVLTNIDAVPTAQPVGTGKRWVRLRVVGDQLMFRTWAGPDEPSGWTWSGTDASIAGPGAVYLTHVQQGTSAQERNVLVDDLTLREGTG